MYRKRNDPCSGTLYCYNTGGSSYSSHLPTHSCNSCNTGCIEQGKDQKYVSSKRCKQRLKQRRISAQKDCQRRHNTLFCHKARDQCGGYSPVTKAQRSKKWCHDASDLCQKALICAGNKVKTCIKVLQEPHDQRCRAKIIVNAFWIKSFAFSQISCPTLFAEGSR